jgi:hypothetical protein
MTVVEGNMGRGILLWLLGVPIPIILLLAPTAIRFGTHACLRG